MHQLLEDGVVIGPDDRAVLALRGRKRKRNRKMKKRSWEEMGRNQSHLSHGLSCASRETPSHHTQTHLEGIEARVDQHIAQLVEYILLVLLP
jgi:hypothetical protein